MDILTPEEKLKEKKLYRTLYIILCVLPIIAFLTVIGYSQSQKTILNNANDAIKVGNVEEAIDWATQLDSMETLDDNNETLLMVACEKGSADMIDWALVNGADPNYAPRGAMSPIELYCSFGFRAGTKPLARLIKAGANVKQYVYTPPIFRLAEKLLYMTPEERDIAFQEMLLLYHAGDKIAYNGTTLFHYVAQFDNAELAEALLMTAAGVKQLLEKDPNGQTPYDLALANGSADVQRLLRKFEEGLLEQLEQEGIEAPEETEPVKDNKAELDALIDSLAEQSANNQSTTPPQEDNEEQD